MDSVCQQSWEVERERELRLLSALDMLFKLQVYSYFISLVGKAPSSADRNLKSKCYVPSESESLMSGYSSCVYLVECV